jgi:thiamine monophosphate synthase
MSIENKTLAQLVGQRAQAVKAAQRAGVTLVEARNKATAATENLKSLNSRIKQLEAAQKTTKPKKETKKPSKTPAKKPVKK